ncbi:MAG: type 1 glutamine amidotransferase [Solirubrobacteraceae bacterium]
MQPLLVLQHIGCEPPAAYEDELLERGLSLRRVQLDEGEQLPDWREHSAIIAMGGPMGAYDDALLPWLGLEKRLIAEAVRAGKPFWGVCLGAQLLAASLGADVAPGAVPEVGVLPVQLTGEAAADPVFSVAPASFDAFHWHGDTYELPRGAVHLARSQLYQQQAFVFANAYALQFHLEVTPALVAGWGAVPAYADGLQRLPGVTLPGLLEQVGGVERTAVALARELFARWLVHVVGVPAAAGE